MRLKTVGFVGVLLLLVLAGMSESTAKAVSNIKFLAMYAEQYALPPGTNCSVPNHNWRCDTFVGAGNAAKNFHREMSAVGTSEITPYEARGWPGFVGSLENNVFDRFGNAFAPIAEDQLDNHDIALVIGHAGAECLAAGDPVPFGCPSRCCGSYIIGHPLTVGFDPPTGHTDLLPFALTKRMFLGDEGRGLSVLSLLGCAMLAPLAGGVGFTPPGWGEPYEHPVGEDIIPRWSNTMRAGLKYVTSTWNTIWFSNVAGIGTNYAKSLKAGKTIKESWVTALKTASSANDPAVYASGKNEADCNRRLDNMTMNNFNTSDFPRLQGNAIGWYCVRAWW